MTGGRDIAGFEWFDVTIRNEGYGTPQPEIHEKRQQAANNHKPVKVPSGQLSHIHLVALARDEESAASVTTQYLHNERHIGADFYDDVDKEITPLSGEVVHKYGRMAVEFMAMYGLEGEEGAVMFVASDETLPVPGKDYPLPPPKL